MVPRKEKRRVFGVGLPRTGTTTLGKCLEILGYRLAEFDFAALEAYAAGNLQHVFATSDQFEAFEDYPWFLLYEEFEARYPDSLYILTTRKDSATWLKSTLGHEKRLEHDLRVPFIKRFTLSFYDAQGVDCKRLENIYDFHNRSVREFFSAKQDRLLTVCWEDGDGWCELCAFLDLPVPQNRPFPHENASPQG
jgi:hypothetical protein